MTKAECVYCQTVVEFEDREIPRCHECGAEASHWNHKTGEVYSWWPKREAEEAKDSLRRMLDGESDVRDLMRGLD